MTCQEFTDFLLAYVSDELADSEKEKFEEHLVLCPDCVAYLKSYELTVKLGERAYADAPLDSDTPEDVPEELIQAILSARKMTS